MIPVKGVPGQGEGCRWWAGSAFPPGRDPMGEEIEAAAQEEHQGEKAQVEESTGRERCQRP